MQASLPRNKFKTLVIPALLAAPVILIFALALLYESDPVLLNQILVAAKIWARGALLIGIYGLLGCLVLTLLIFPNALPHLRIALRNSAKRMNFNRRAAAEILRRMEDFQSIPDLLTLAQIYLDSEQGKMAMPLLIEVVKREPQNARAHLLLAKVFKSARQWDDASDLADRAIELDPGIAFGAAHMLATECSLAAGRMDRALGLARQYLTKYGESILGLSMLAKALEAPDAAAERSKLLRRLLELPSATAKENRFTPEEALERLEARKLLARGQLS